MSAPAQLRRSGWGEPSALTCSRRRRQAQTKLTSRQPVHHFWCEQLLLCALYSLRPVDDLPRHGSELSADLLARAVPDQEQVGLRRIEVQRERLVEGLVQLEQVGLAGGSLRNGGLAVAVVQGVRAGGSDLGLRELVVPLCLREAIQLGWNVEALAASFGLAAPA